MFVFVSSCFSQVSAFWPSESALQQSITVMLVQYRLHQLLYLTWVYGQTFVVFSTTYPGWHGPQLDHIATVTKSIAPLPTGFHYPDYLYLSDFQLLNCSSFSAHSADANACSSGKIALLSTGSGSMVFGTPDSSGYSNYRYMNLSSMVSSEDNPDLLAFILLTSRKRVTNLENTDVFVLFQFIPPYAHGGLSFAFSTYEFQIPQGSSRLLIPSLEEAGLTYVQTLQFTCQKGHNNSDASGPARLVFDSFNLYFPADFFTSVAFDDVEIVVPHTSPSGRTYTPTPVSTGCPTTAVTRCAACVPATPTATTHVLTVYF
jgi:hypothetical protein